MLAYLRLNGVNARNHPVFRELTRVKQYFEKIRVVESDASAKETSRLDKAAAGRFIKHALVQVNDCFRSCGLTRSSRLGILTLIIRKRCSRDKRELDRISNSNKNPKSER